jgi:hypothetical protein
MLPALEHRAGINPLLAVCLFISNEFHLKRIIARPVVTLSLRHGSECGRPAVGKGGAGQKAKEDLRRAFDSRKLSPRRERRPG